MSKRFHALPAFVLLAVGLALPAVAQAPDSESPADALPLPMEPPKELPKAQRGDPAQNLDRLFAALKVAPTAESAKYIEGRIWAAWAAGGGDTAAVLMTRARTATETKDLDLAIKLLTAIIEIKPDYIEAWNRRAALYFVKRDLPAAMVDLRGVLRREPRHFGAWAGLGMILQDIGDERRALEAFRRAVALHPHMERIPELVKRLTLSVEGREI